jgi:alkylation response protein AidB-like acyl-CoA dehydrogenase
VRRSAFERYVTVPRLIPTTDFNDDMRLFVDHRVDWERYFRWKRGADVDPAAEVETYKTIMQTAGEICAEIAAAARDHWHEEVRLENGLVVRPPRIDAGFEKLKEAGLIGLTVDPKYGGYAASRRRRTTRHARSPGSASSSASRSSTSRS